MAEIYVDFNSRDADGLIFVRAERVPPHLAVGDGLVVQDEEGDEYAARVADVDRRGNVRLAVEDNGLFDDEGSEVESRHLVSH